MNGVPQYLQTAASCVGSTSSCPPHWVHMAGTRRVFWVASLLICDFFLSWYDGLPHRQISLSPTRKRQAFLQPPRWQLSFLKKLDHTKTAVQHYNHVIMSLSCNPVKISGNRNGTRRISLLRKTVSPLRGQWRQYGAHPAASAPR